MTQIQLSDAQAVILSTACAREDGAIFPVTASLKGGAVGNVCKSLLKQGLIEEIAATDLNTVWRHDEERGPITLRATPLAYSTLGITDEQDETPPAETPPAPVQRRKGTKQETLIEMLRAEGGATIDEIVEATGCARRHVRRAQEEAGPDDHLREGRGARPSLLPAARLTRHTTTVTMPPSRMGQRHFIVPRAPGSPRTAAAGRRTARCSPP
jgi:hypothetical protein